jgi:hypothetical protein
VGTLEEAKTATRAVIRALDRRLPAGVDRWFYSVGPRSVGPRPVSSVDRGREHRRLWHAHLVAPTIGRVDRAIQLEVAAAVAAVVTGPRGLRVQLVRQDDETTFGRTRDGKPGPLIKFHDMPDSQVRAGMTWASCSHARYLAENIVAALAHAAPGEVPWGESRRERAFRPGWSLTRWLAHYADRVDTPSAGDPAAYRGGRCLPLAAFPVAVRDAYLDALAYGPDQRAAWRRGGKVDMWRRQHFASLRSAPTRGAAVATASPTTPPPAPSPAPPAPPGAELETCGGQLNDGRTPAGPSALATRVAPKVLEAPPAATDEAPVTTARASWTTCEQQQAQGQHDRATGYRNPAPSTTAWSSSPCWSWSCWSWSCWSSSCWSSSVTPREQRRRDAQRLGLEAQPFAAVTDQIAEILDHRPWLYPAWRALTRTLGAKGGSAEVRQRQLIHRFYLARGRHASTWWRHRAQLVEVGLLQVDYASTGPRFGPGARRRLTLPLHRQGRRPWRPTAPAIAVATPPKPPDRDQATPRGPPPVVIPAIDPAYADVDSPAAARQRIRRLSQST